MTSQTPVLDEPLQAYEVGMRWGYSGPAEVPPRVVNPGSWLTLLLRGPDTWSGNRGGAHVYMAFSQRWRRLLRERSYSQHQPVKPRDGYRPWARAEKGCATGWEPYKEAAADCGSGSEASSSRSPTHPPTPHRLPTLVCIGQPAPPPSVDRGWPLASGLSPHPRPRHPC